MEYSMAGRMVTEKAVDWVAAMETRLVASTVHRRVTVTGLLLDYKTVECWAYSLAAKMVTTKVESSALLLVALLDN